MDIHSHIVWDLDDGARNREQSVAMLRAAAAAGTSAIVATPHSNAQYTYRPELVHERIGELQRLAGGRLEIHRGCELHLSFDCIDPMFESPARYTINGRQYLLLELPDHHVGDYADKIFARLLGAGIVPVIAHPERNPYLQQNPKRLKRWVEAGCLVQLTALSITGGFGSQAKAAGFRLLAQGLVHAVASDAHDAVHRHPSLEEAAAAVGAQRDEHAVDTLFSENPGKIIQGLPVGRELPPSPGARRWFFGTKPPTSRLLPAG